MIVVAGAAEAAAPCRRLAGGAGEALGRQPLRAAVDAVTEAYGLKRKDVYDAALALKAEESAPGVAAERFGHRGEALAALLPAAKLYRIVARRFKTPVGEIDLIAARFGVTGLRRGQGAQPRGDRSRGAGRRQPRRIVRAAQFYLARHPHLADTPLRFDVIFLAPRQAATASRQRLRAAGKLAMPFEHRRADGPHRLHQPGWRFDLRADARGAGARHTASTTTRPHSLALRDNVRSAVGGADRGVRHGEGRALPRSANPRARTSPPTTWC